MVWSILVPCIFKDTLSSVIAQYIYCWPCIIFIATVFIVVYPDRDHNNSYANYLHINVDSPCYYWLVHCIYVLFMQFSYCCCQLGQCCNSAQRDLVVMWWWVNIPGSAVHARFESREREQDRPLCSYISSAQGTARIFWRSLVLRTHVSFSMTTSVKTRNAISYNIYIMLV